MTIDGNNSEVEVDDLQENEGPQVSDKNEEEKIDSMPGADSLAEKLALEKDRILRLSAEFENYKKRKQREIDEFKKFANETVLKQFLSVVDNMERAMDSVQSNNQENTPICEETKGLLAGVELIYKDVLNILENFHVRPVEAKDAPFDHNFHQAVTQEEVDDIPDKTVVRVLQKGYLFHDRLLRPAMVVVSKKSLKDEQQINEIG